MKRILIIIAFTVYTFNVYSQEVQKELMRINSAYQKLEQLKMDIHVAVYDITGSSVKEETFGNMNKYSGKQWMKLGSLETFVDGNIMLSVEHTEKLILLGKKIVEKDKIPESTFNIDINQIKSICDTFFVEEINNEQKSISFLIPDYMYEKIEIHYNPQNYFINKIIYFYASEAVDYYHSSRIEMVYKHIKKEFSMTDISLNQYVLKTKDGYKLQPAYKEYQFINQLQEK